MSINYADTAWMLVSCGNGIVYDPGTGILLWRTGTEKKLPLHHHDELRLSGTYKCTMGFIRL